MQRVVETETGVPLALREAAEIVATTIADRVALAIWAADVCGCPGCRARAAQTMTWAFGMDLGDEEVGAEVPHLLPTGPGDTCR